jgi:hypothetical protein
LLGHGAAYCIGEKLYDAGQDLSALPRQQLIQPRQRQQFFLHPANRLHAVPSRAARESASASAFPGNLSLARMRQCVRQKGSKANFIFTTDRIS